MRPCASGRPQRHRRAALATTAAVLLLGGASLPAVADPGSDDGEGTPTRAEVEAAQEAVGEQKRTVADVRTDLLLANQRLEKAAIQAAQAAEAYNAARWKLREARAEARAAEDRQARAEQDLSRHEAIYNELVATTYEMSPELSTLSAIIEQDGAKGLIETANTTYQVSSSMEEIESAYRASLELAELAGDQADRARDRASDLAGQAAAARAHAQARADAAAAEADRIARRKDELLAELADLQHISVRLAARRQAALEQRAQEQAAAAAAAAAEQAAQEAEHQEQDQQPGSTPTDQGGPEPEGDPEQQPEPDPQPDPDPPAPSGGASVAISFARAQLGEPYRWGADGPDSWDCSGLTMRAWQAGGTYLPHYSVGQYADSSPISSSELQPGDLVFWGSSTDPGSIYHVALYLGGGRIIHAPRTGRPVTEDSMYYWIPPNFFARP